MPKPPWRAYLHPALKQRPNSQTSTLWGPVRLYNVMCWIYGSDPIKYSQLVGGGSLPENRAVRCPGEWDRMAKAWQRLPAEYRP